MPIERIRCKYCEWWVEARPKEFRDNRILASVEAGVGDILTLKLDRF